MRSRVAVTAARPSWRLSVRRQACLLMTMLSVCAAASAAASAMRAICAVLWQEAVMVISVLAGRTSPEEKSLSEIYPYTLEFHERFKAAFGGTACGELMQFEFNTKEHLKNCIKLVNKVAQLLAEYLVEKGLLKE